MTVHMRSLILFIAMSSSAADVDVTETLAGTEGGNVTLPVPVGELGLVLFNVATLAVVQNSSLDIWQERYRDRVLRNATTGLFTITGLQKDDSGIYTVESKTGKVSAESYKLTVYAPVAGPTVETVSVTSESCLLLCSVDEAAEVTLWWSRDEEILNQTSSADSLLLMVTQQNLSSSYRCEAGNPAENRTLPVPVQTLCSGLNHTGDAELVCTCCPEAGEGCSESWWFLVPLLGFKAVVLLVILLQK